MVLNQRSEAYGRASLKKKRLWSQVSLGFKLCSSPNNNGPCTIYLTLLNLNVLGNSTSSIIRSWKESVKTQQDVTASSWPIKGTCKIVPSQHLQKLSSYIPYGQVLYPMHIHIYPKLSTRMIQETLFIIAKMQKCYKYPLRIEWTNRR